MDLAATVRRWYHSGCRGPGWIDDAGALLPMGRGQEPRVLRIRVHHPDSAALRRGLHRQPAGDQTLFTWVVAIEAKDRFRLPVKVLAPLLKAGLGQVPAGGQRYFAKQA